MAQSPGKTVYINNTENAITPLGGKTVEPGALYYPPDGRYLLNDKGLTLLRHRPSPSRELHASTIGEGISLTDLQKYHQIVIKNDSGAAISVIFNADTDHARVILANTDDVFEHDQEISTLAITGEGEGNVYVYGEGF